MLHLFMWWHTSIMFCIYLSGIVSTEQEIDFKRRSIQTTEIPRNVDAQFIHRLLNNDSIKKRLDEFSMVKMKSYVPYGKVEDFVQNKSIETTKDRIGDAIKSLKEFMIRHGDINDTQNNKTVNQSLNDVDNNKETKIINNTDENSDNVQKSNNTYEVKIVNKTGSENCSLNYNMRPLSHTVSWSQSMQNPYYKIQNTENTEYKRDHNILPMRRQYYPIIYENSESVVTQSVPYISNRGPDIDTYNIPLDYDETNIIAKELANDKIDTDYPNGENDDEVNYRKALYEVLRKQNELVEKLALRIEKDRNSMRSGQDFELLLAEMTKKKQQLAVKKAMEAAATTTEKTTTAVKVIATIKTVIDETEVREALKNDPFVQRILKMANRKREQYLKEVKKRKLKIRGEAII